MNKKTDLRDRFDELKDDPTIQALIDSEGLSRTIVKNHLDRIHEFLEYIANPLAKYKRILLMEGDKPMTVFKKGDPEVEDEKVLKAYPNSDLSTEEDIEVSLGVYVEAVEIHSDYIKKRWSLHGRRYNIIILSLIKSGIIVRTPSYKSEGDGRRSKAFCMTTKGKDFLMDIEILDMIDR